MVSTNNWDSVPWTIGGGAKHSTNVGRLVAYAAFGGKEGIVGSGDLLVREMNPPGPQVRVLPGACSIINRAAGIEYEAYACRLPIQDEIDVPPTDASGAAHYMVVGRVENPHIEGEPWNPPADPVVGPYMYTRLIPCNATAETIADLPAQYQAQSLLPLARLDLPANTYVVTQAMVTDLRRMYSPRIKRIQRIINLPNGAPAERMNTDAFTVFPNQSYWTEYIPGWATVAQVTGWMSSTRLVDEQNQSGGGQWVGQLRVQHGTMYTQPVEVNVDAIVGGGATQTAPTIMAAGDFYIPKDHRGSSRDLSFQARRTNVDGRCVLTADWGTCVVIEVTYYEEPDQQGWEN